ncbi:hypothetical protein LXL04_028020 [Taraxacum kok-saghyz]
MLEVEEQRILENERRNTGTSHYHSISSPTALATDHSGRSGFSRGGGARGGRGSGRNGRGGRSGGRGGRSTYNSQQGGGRQPPFPAQISAGWGFGFYPLAIVGQSQAGLLPSPTQQPNRSSNQVWQNQNQQLNGGSQTPQAYAATTQQQEFTPPWTWFSQLAPA